MLYQVVPTHLLRYAVRLRGPKVAGDVGTAVGISMRPRDLSAVTSLPIEDYSRVVCLTAALTDRIVASTATVIDPNLGG